VTAATRAIPQSGSGRATFISKMGPICWLFSNDAELLNLYYTTALSSMRLDGLHAWADAIEAGEIITCTTCGKAAILAGYATDEETPLCERCAE
jgi:hypothetical protein